MNNSNTTSYQSEATLHTLSVLCMLTQTATEEHGSFEKIYKKTQSGSQTAPLNSKKAKTATLAKNDERAKEWHLAFNISDTNPRFE